MRNTYSFSSVVGFDAHKITRRGDEVVFRWLFPVMLD
jgi:hypothetical protein